MNAADTNSAKPVSKRRDLLHAPSALWLWCLPIGIVIFANSRYSSHSLSFTATGVLLTIAVLWIGIACYINGRGCGRLHCRIDGVLLPLLSVLGLLNLLHMVSLGWATYTDVLTAIVIVSFIAEYVDNKMHHNGGSAAVC